MTLKGMEEKTKSLEETLDNKAEEYKELLASSHAAFETNQEVLDDEGQILHIIHWTNAYYDAIVMYILTHITIYTDVKKSLTIEEETVGASQPVV